MEEIRINLFFAMTCFCTFTASVHDPDSYRSIWIRLYYTNTDPDPHHWTVKPYQFSNFYLLFLSDCRMVSSVEEPVCFLSAPAPTFNHLKIFFNIILPCRKNSF